MTTLKQIARQADVSIGTVDRVIHNRGKVSKKAEIKVKRAIEKLKYAPNIFARHLKLSKDFCFGVIMPEVNQDSGFWKMPVQGIQKALGELKNHRVCIRFFYYNRYSQFKKFNFHFSGFI